MIRAHGRRALALLLAFTLVLSLLLFFGAGTGSCAASDVDGNGRELFRGSADQCRSERLLSETRADWRASVSGALITGRWDLDLIAVARTQVGYRESSQDYVERNGVRHGYTRYGDWIGNSEAVVYGPWCASFACFCIYYANIKGVPFSANCATWVKKLGEEGMFYEYGKLEPRAGDLAFFYSGKEKDAEKLNATHVGIIAEIREKGFVTIEGNIGNTVGWREYEYKKTGDQILGFARLPDNPDYLSFEDASGCVRISGVLPQDTTVRVRSLAENELGPCELPSGRVLDAYEISLFSGEEEYEPKDAMYVQLRPGDLPEGKLQVIHYRLDEAGAAKENWAVEQLRREGNTLTFLAFRLSRFVVVEETPPETVQRLTNTSGIRALT